jgi:hypothetical protein
MLLAWYLLYRSAFPNFVVVFRENWAEFENVIRRASIDWTRVDNLFVIVV